jgi:uncharacterized SAM-dependent methyltransferase
MDSKRRNIEKHQVDEASARKQAYDETERKNRCMRAQRDVRVYETALPVYFTNEKGERVFLEDKERFAELARSRRDVDTYCR